jgi:hypothetical protein
MENGGLNMTDLDKLKTLLTEFGVGFEEDYDPQHIRTFIQCKEGFDKVRGYSLFYTLFEFDIDGNFTEMGAYE